MAYANGMAKRVALQADNLRVFLVFNVKAQNGTTPIHTAPDLAISVLRMRMRDSPPLAFFAKVGPADITCAVVHAPQRTCFSNAFER